MYKNDGKLHRPCSISKLSHTKRVRSLTKSGIKKNHQVLFQWSSRSKGMRRLWIIDGVVSMLMILAGTRMRWMHFVETIVLDEYTSGQRRIESLEWFLKRSSIYGYREGHWNANESVFCIYRLHRNLGPMLISWLEESRNS